jgi:hypothetical protein
MAGSHQGGTDSWMEAVSLGGELAKVMADRHIIPAGEESKHKANSTCPCKPSPSGEGTGIWMTWYHKEMKGK